MNPSPNLILVGPMGAGKTCIGRHLAKHFGLTLVDADREIEQQAGARVSDIFEREGEAGFRIRERAVLDQLLARHELLLSTGGGAVLDADNRQLLRARGFVVYLQVSVQQQLARLAHDRSRPLLARDDRQQVLHDLAAVREPLYAEVADLIFDTNPYTVNQSAHALAAQLESHWQRQGATA